MAIGYLPAFKGLADAVRRADFRNYTHVDLAFVNPGPSGKIMMDGVLVCAPAGSGSMVTDEALREVVRKAHEAGAKILVSIGGGTVPACGGDWAELARPEDAFAYSPGGPPMGMFGRPGAIGSWSPGPSQPSRAMRIASASISSRVRRRRRQSAR